MSSSAGHNASSGLAPAAAVPSPSVEPKIIRTSSVHAHHYNANNASSYHGAPTPSISTGPVGSSSRRNYAAIPTVSITPAINTSVARNYVPPPTENDALLKPHGSIRKKPSSKKDSWIAWFWNVMRFMGPGFMVGVGYLDPGNWATDLASGSEFGYSLLYIVLIANLMAIVLQYLCIKLGVVTGLDLAMACKKYLPERLSMFFYILCQLAIIATDCAEVIGTAIALDLLFGIPLVWGVALTGLDVLVILALWDANNLKAFEKAILFLVALVALCFVYLLTLSNPDWALVGRGLIPTTEIFRSSSMLYLAMSIIGATIMPHNLYLHSSIVRYRSGKQVENLGEITEPEPMTPRSARTPRTPALPSPGTLAQIEEDMGIEIQAPQRKEFIPQTLMFSNIDSVVALTGALLVNGAILTVSAASFHNSGEEVGELKDAYNLLVHHLGSIAGVAFALALLAAGQSSTITGTLTGQIVTEGFLGTEYAMEPWLQRLITRALAITPAMLVCFIAGESGVNQLLVFSQVVLSLQLPFAIWPLVWFTSDKEKMTVVFPAARVDGHHVFEERSYENSRFLHWVAVFIAILITIFNVILIVEVFDGAGSYIYASLF